VEPLLNQDLLQAVLEIKAETVQHLLIAPLAGLAEAEAALEAKVFKEPQLTQQTPVLVELEDSMTLVA
jgi:hypothetical protein